MEKLEPILKHKFWICFAVAVLVPTTGFYMVSGSLKKAIDVRKRQIKKKFSKIPNEKKINASANRQFIVALTEMNVGREKRIKSAALKLLNRQKSLMVWPAMIRPRMKGVKYREATLPRIREDYKNIHQAEYERIRQILVPFNPKDGTGKIQAPLSIIPQAKDPWVTNESSPSNRQMWDTQEDIWLFTSIFEAIARVNKDADVIAKTPIRAVKTMGLHGGSRPDKSKAKKTQNNPASPYAAPTAGYSPVSSSTNARTISFKPIEVFGPETITATGRPTYDDDEESRGGLGSRLTGRKARGRRKDDDDQGPGSEPTNRRYIDDEGFPFKTRGFYLEVIIEHQRLPNLLAELSNMPWPTKILKVQQGDEVSVAFVPDSSTNATQKVRRKRRPLATTFGGGDPDGDDDYVAPAARRNANAGHLGSRAFEAAMRDPSLSHVSIAGIMLIYKPPGESKAVAQKIPGQPVKPSTRIPGRSPQPKSAQPTPAKAQPAPGAAASQPDLKKKATASGSSGSKFADPAKRAGKADSKKQPAAPTPNKAPATPEKAAPDGGNDKGKATAEPARPTTKGKKTATTIN